MTTPGLPVDVDTPPLLPVTTRADLRAGASVNLHCGWQDDPPWGVQGKRAPLVQAVLDLGVGLVRDAMFVHDPEAQAWYAALADAGVGLLLNVPDVRMRYAADDVAYAAGQPWARAVRLFAGRNEPNNNDSTDAWVKPTVEVQKALHDAVMAHLDAFPALDGILGPACKHEHVDDYDGDRRKLAAAGIADYTGWIDPVTRQKTGRPLLDFHFYPGQAGPIHNTAEKLRAEADDGNPVDVHSETGWDDDDSGITPEVKARFSVEAILRARFDGTRLVSLYELTDDSTGRKGLVHPDGTPKAAATAVGALLAAPDGGEPFPGYIGPHPGGEPADVDAVCTSDGAGRWTIYLCRNDQPTAHLVVPTGYTCDVGVGRTGSAGNRVHYSIPLDESMVTAHVARN